MERFFRSLKTECFQRWLIEILLMLSDQLRNTLLDITAKQGRISIAVV
jgi:hypothetical protein